MDTPVSASKRCLLVPFPNWKTRSTKKGLLQRHKRKFSSESSANKMKSEAEVREDVAYKTLEQMPGDTALS